MHLGTVDGHPIQLPEPVLRASARHAQRIAHSLGSGDWQSSVAAYWGLAGRIEQWQLLIERCDAAGMDVPRIVEIGSGMGLWTLVGRCLGYRVIGVEPSSDRYAASLRNALSLFAANEVTPDLIQAHSEALPLPTRSVDVIASFQTFEHVAALRTTLHEIRRVLKPGGILFAQAPNYGSLYEAHYGVVAPLPWGKAWTRHWLRLLGRPVGFLDHLQWINPAVLRAELRIAGFTAISVGPPARPRVSGSAIPASSVPLSFRYRRGIRAERAARLLARVLNRAGIAQDLYPQMEIWARAT